MCPVATMLAAQNTTSIIAEVLLDGLVQSLQSPVGVASSCLTSAHGEASQLSCIHFAASHLVDNPDVKSPGLCLSVLTHVG